MLESTYNIVQLSLKVSTNETSFVKFKKKEIINGRDLNYLPLKGSEMDVVLFYTLRV